MKKFGIKRELIVIHTVVSTHITVQNGPYDVFLLLHYVNSCNTCTTWCKAQGRIHRVGTGGTCPSQTQHVLTLSKPVCTNVEYTNIRSYSMPIHSLCQDFYWQ